MTFAAIEGQAFPASKVTFRRCSYAPLLHMIHIVLRRSLYAFAAGLYLYKMYSIRTHRDNIYLKMSDSVVALKNRVAPAGKQVACNILSLLSSYLSFISAIFHSPSTFVNVAILSLLSPYGSARE